MAELTELQALQVRRSMRELDDIWTLGGQFALDDWLPARLHAFTDLITGESKIYNAIVVLLNKWATRLREAVFGVHTLPDPHGVSTTEAWFSTAVDNVVDIEIKELFLDSADFEVDSDPDALAQVSRFVAASKNRLTRIPDSVYTSVRSATMKATTEGWSIDELESRVEDILAESGSETWRNRARVIARTEALAAYNGGKFASFQSVAKQMGGSWEKVWLATHDHRTRKTHARITGADGQRVPLNAPFSVGGFDLMYPGDPAGPPQEVIQCRCSILLARPGEEPDLSNRGYRGKP